MDSFGLHDLHSLAHGRRAGERAGLQCLAAPQPPSSDDAQFTLQDRDGLPAWPPTPPPGPLLQVLWPLVNRIRRASPVPSKARAGGFLLGVLADPTYQGIRYVFSPCFCS